jgi:hypothetical protein
MGELTTEERAEVIRALKEHHPGAGPGADVESFFTTKPLTLHFYAMIVRGLLKDSREATDTFLRSLSKELLETLALTLGDLLRSNEDQEDPWQPSLRKWAISIYYSWKTARSD